MGQLVFAPNAQSGGSGNDGATFLERLFVAEGDVVSYGFNSGAGGAEAFYSQADWTMIVAFRVVALSAEPVNVIDCRDEDLSGWSVSVENGNNIVGRFATLSLVPGTQAPALGRVVIAAVTYNSSEGDETGTFFLNGLPVASAQGIMPSLVESVNLVIGSRGNDWVNDAIEYVGFAFINALLSAEQNADLAVATQDTKRITIPADIVGTRAVYNADDGLTDLALWVPAINTMAAPSLPALPSGITETGEIKIAPFFPAFSGWAVPAGV